MKSRLQGFVVALSFYQAVTPFVSVVRARTHFYFSEMSMLLEDISEFR